MAGFPLCKGSDFSTALNIRCSQQFLPGIFRCNVHVSGLCGRGLIRGSGYKDSGTPHVLPKHFDSLSLSLSTPIARSIASFLPPTTPLYIALYFLHYQRGSGSNGSISPGRRLFVGHFYSSGSPSWCQSDQNQIPRADAWARQIVRKE